MYFSKIQIGFYPFWYRLTLLVSGKAPLNVCVCVCVCIVDIYFVSIPDAFGRLTKKPQNALSVGSQRPQLNCSTDGDNGNNLIEWTYDHVHIVWPPCVSQDPHSFVVSSPDPATDCNVQAASPTAGDISGAYVCSDRTEKAVAMIIQLGSFPLRLITSCIYYDYYCGLLSQLIVEYDRHCLTLSMPTGGHPAISRNGNLQCRVKSGSFFGGMNHTHTPV